MRSTGGRKSSRTSQTIDSVKHEVKDFLESLVTKLAELENPSVMFCHGLHTNVLYGV